ncbi:hypothetical protein VTH06DRAFT_8540 [Thermothelomyces fergusii]
MDVCYCANYYSSVRCTNTVGKFGQRCGLCTILKTGASLSPGRLPDDCLWLLSQPPSREEHEDQHPAKSLRESRRPSWIFAGISMAALRLSTADASLWKNGRANTKA